MRLRARTVPRAGRAEARRLLAEAFDALEGEVSAGLHRRLDAAATPPGPPIEFRRRIGVWQDLTTIDDALVERCIERWDWAERRADRIEQFLESVGFAAPPGTLKVPQEGSPAVVDLDLTEG